MFSSSEIKKFNNVEMLIYNYILQNSKQIPYMTIRESADSVHVSTSTIMRFCKKLNCDGYSEFKVQFKMYMEKNKEIKPIDDISEIMNYFNSANTSEYKKNLDEIATIIREGNHIIFGGVGTSGILGKYGARYFSNMGKFSHYIDDPFYPNFEGLYKDAVVIMLSVSGETEQIISLSNIFLKHGCKLISITNSKDCTLAKMSDYNIAYYMNNKKTKEEYNITTQIPVIFIIEAIAKRL